MPETLIKSETYAAHTQRLQASAINLDGATVNDDIINMIGDYQRKEGVIWPLITKKRAKHPTIKEGVKDKFPKVGAVNKFTLDHAAANVENPPGSLNRDLTDPGQDLKAISGQVDIPHFAHSMAQQQGYFYEDTFAEDTDDMILSGVRYLDRQLIVGDAAGNVDEFNGFLNLRNPANTDIELDTLIPGAELIHQALNRICIKAANEPNNRQRISHIFTSGGGQNELIREAHAAHIHQNQVEITPGHVVSAIVTPSGNKNLTPVIGTPYILDDDSDVAFDLIDYWLIDMTQIEWHGLVPLGGQNNLDYQIFDFTKYVNGIPLTEKRMLLLYGCLFAKNQGRGIYRLRVKLPKGRAITYS